MKKLLSILVLLMFTISSVYAVTAPVTIKPPTITKAEAQLMSSNLPQSTLVCGGGCNGFEILIKNTQSTGFNLAGFNMINGETCPTGITNYRIEPLGTTVITLQALDNGRGISGVFLFTGVAITPEINNQVLFILAKQDRCVLKAGENKSMVVTNIQGADIILSGGSFKDGTPGKLMLGLPKQSSLTGSEQSVTTSGKRTTAQRPRGVSK